MIYVENARELTEKAPASLYEEALKNIEKIQKQQLIKDIANVLYQFTKIQSNLQNLLFIIMAML